MTENVLEHNTNPIPSQAVVDAAERSLLLEFHFGQSVNVYIDQMTTCELKLAEVSWYYNADKTRALYDANEHFQNYWFTYCKDKFCAVCLNRRPRLK
jgi:hypothetical protein